MHVALIVADLNGRIFQWLDRYGPLLTRSGGKPRRWPPTAFPKRTLRACSASRSRPCASIAVSSSTRQTEGLIASILPLLGLFLQIWSPAELRAIIRVGANAGRRDNGRAIDRDAGA